MEYCLDNKIHIFEKVTIDLYDENLQYVSDDVFEYIGYYADDKFYVYRDEYDIAEEGYQKHLRSGFLSAVPPPRPRPVKQIRHRYFLYEEYNKRPLYNSGYQQMNGIYYYKGYILPSGITVEPF
jgi:hypothetical protein